MFHEHHEESCKDEVCKDCEKGDGKERTTKSISESDEHDTCTDLSAGEHTDAEGKALCEASVTIGAGSVVTRNIPSNVVAVGNPCRVIKNI